MLADINLEQFRKIYAVNVDGVFLGMKYAAMTMRPGGSSGRGGSIINLSSIAGITGTIGEAAYGSSKGVVRMLSKHAAIEFAALGYGIRVNSVHPGVIDTPMGDQVFETLGSDQILGSTEAAKEFVTSLIPMKRMGEPEEVAQVVCFMASDASTYITGSEYMVDGGVTAM